jgi:hypothetical protein
MKINLISAETIYMIRRKDLFDPYFFLYDYLEIPIDIQAVLWTPNKFKAREFYSEESVETFFYEKLNNRPCEIIMVK